MKKLALVALLASVTAMPFSAAYAAEEKKLAPAAGETVELKKVELNNGIWVQAKDWNVGTEVKASKDGGKTWMDAPDGVHTSKDGKVILTTKGGKVEKVEVK